MWLGIFSTKSKYFSKKSWLIVLLGKQSIMSLALNFKKEVAHMFIHLYGFSVHQILKIKLREFTEKTKKAQLRDYLNYLKLFELVKTYHAHSNTWWKYSKNESRFSHYQYFTEDATITKLFDFKFSNDKKQEF